MWALNRREWRAKRFEADGLVSGHPDADVRIIEAIEEATRTGAPSRSRGADPPSMTREEKLRVLADAAKYDASCASSGARRGRGARRPRQQRRHRHLPQLHAGRPLRLAAQDPADQLLHLRLPSTASTGSRSDMPRARFSVERGRRPHARLLPPQLHRRAVPQLGHHPVARLHDGAAGRGRADAARDASLRRLHPPQGDPRRQRRR